MPQGVVRWFDAERGFGFIDRGEESEDLFVHASEIVGDDGPRVLREGQVVEFEVGEGDRGPQARRVRVTGDQADDALLGVLGTVAWYEPAKGYGFITPDGGGGEIFVHSSAIVGGGVISPGQRVAFLVVDGEKGPQADHLLPLGAQAAPAQASDGADGTVTFFDPDKGFGFVTPDAGGDDLFVHARSLLGGLRELSDGDRVRYVVAEGDRGPQARDVEVVGGASRRTAAPGGRSERPRSFGAPSSGSPARGARPHAGQARGAQARGDAPVRGGEGVVARYDADRGFGFITPDAGGADLFVHASVVRGSEPLEAGDRIRYSVRQSDRGAQADRVERV